MICGRLRRANARTFGAARLNNRAFSIPLDFATVIIVLEVILEKGLL
jgi:hypothetical protein